MTGFPPHLVNENSQEKKNIDLKNIKKKQPQLQAQKKTTTITGLEITYP